MPVNFTLPPDTRAVGTGDPANDMDAVIDALKAIGAPGNVLSAAWAGGADPTGVADSSPAIQAALNAGTPVVFLPAGTYLLKSDLVMGTAGQQLAGAGIDTTILQPANAGTTFTNAMINITADKCRVTGMRFQGISGTITTNTAVSAIQINGTFHTFIDRIEGLNINGWVVDLESTNSSTNIFLFRVGARTCAGGIKLASTNGTTVGATLDNCGSAQCGVATGAFANLDGLLIQNTADIMGTNLGFSTGANTTGHGIHLAGVTACFLTNLDCGGFPTPASGSGQAGIKIEDFGGRHNSQIVIINGLFQTWDLGAYITGAGFDVRFVGCTFCKNQRHGAQVEATFANPAFFEDCHFGVSGGNNGQVPATFSYTATNASPAVFTAAGSAFANGTPLQLAATGIPAGFSAATTYWVVSVSGATFSLAATAGGAAINSTSTGTGTLTLTVYDLWWNTTASGAIRHTTFGSGIVAAGSVGVQQSLAIPSGNGTQVIYPRFTGTAAASGNWYTNTPANSVKF